MGYPLRSKVKHFKDNTSLPFLVGLAEECLIHRCGNVFFSTITTDLRRYFFENDGCLVAFEDNGSVPICGGPV
jgi:hypothetical protein